MTLLVVLFTAAAPAAAGAFEDCRSAIPDGPEHAYLRVALSERAPATSEDRRRVRVGLQTACDELDMQTSAGRFFLSPRRNSVRLLDGMADAAVAAGLAAANISDLLRDSGAPHWYREALEAMRQDPDAHRRVRRVYELVARRQGEYDGENASLEGTFRRPLIRSFGERFGGAPGLCRDFAVLLYVSLHHARRPARGVEGESFQVALVNGFGPDESQVGDISGHTWVRVAFPSDRGWEQVDLDTTYYSDWTPLPRRFMQEDVEARLQACRETARCVSRALNDGRTWWKTAPDGQGRRLPGPYH